MNSCTGSSSHRLWRRCKPVEACMQVPGAPASDPMTSFQDEELTGDRTGAHPSANFQHCSEGALTVFQAGRDGHAAAAVAVARAPAGFVYRATDACGAPPLGVPPAAAAVRAPPPHILDGDRPAPATHP